MTKINEAKSALIGQSVQRKEGVSKLTGKARYIDDMAFHNCLHGVTIRSTEARAQILDIQFLPGIPWDEFTIVTAKDIPGINTVTMIYTDQPFLADGFVNHPEEAILLIAHADLHLVQKARDFIKIVYQKLPAVFSIDEALSKKAIVWGEDNVFKKYHLQKGAADLAPIFAQADFVVEGEYLTGAQEQLYIENNGMVAQANPQDGVTIWGSMQCPYYVHKGLVPMFALAPEKVRIIQAETGGGFGGKEEYPTLIAGHAALLAWKSGKTVKIIYDRAEDMVATTKRHPSRTKIKTALSKYGKILAQDIEFIIDGGAYATLSSVVLSRGTIHAAGPYFCENVQIKSQAVATNHPPHGAFRGFGAPQSLFAMERHMNQIALKLQISEEQIRRINFLKDGLTTATGQVVNERVDLNKLLDSAFAHSNYHEKLQKFKEHNKNSKIKKGIGFATFMHGGGFTGSGEKYLASKVGIRFNDQNKIEVLAASTEIGQGTNSIFAQIAADALGVSYDFVDVLRPDTRFVPNSGPTVASRTVMVVGKLVESASLGLKQTLIQAGLLKEKYSEAELLKACQDYQKTFGELKVIVEYQQPPHIHWDDEKYQGEAYGAYAWAVYLAEVSVDTVTYETKVDDFVAIQEIGKVVHPTFAAGQIEGGVAQGIGYAIYEKVVWNQGRMQNGQMTNYIMPTSVDLPPIRVFFAEEPYAYGPAGAKGIGELPMDGPAPAILNAIQNATGLCPVEIPFLPENMMQLMKQKDLSI